MLSRNLVLITLASATLYGCSSSDPAAVAAISGLALPANIEVIADDAANQASLAAANMAAYNSVGTDYTNLKTEFWINAGQWQEPLNMADMLVCIMNASSHKDLINVTYQGIIDMNICNSDAGNQADTTAHFADVVVKNSRASNTGIQTGTSWFTNPDDKNDDGDTLDAGEIDKYAAEMVMTAGSSAANPFGVFSMNWNKDNAVSGDYSRGSLSISDDSTTKVGISFLEQNKKVANPNAHNYDQWVKGELNKDGSGGKVQVSHVEGATTTVYKINFNATHANVDEAGTATCNNLDESTMTTYIDRYNLYNATTGALIDIAAGLEFVHGSGKDKRGYAGSYFDNSGTEKWWMWVEDGSTPTTIYSESNNALSYSVSWSSGKPTVSGLTLVPPIRITASYLGTPPGGTAATQTADLNYEGAGQLWGIDWDRNGDTNGNGDCDSGENSCTKQWEPDFNLSDGLLLTGTNGVYNGVQYRVKRVEGWKTLATVASSNCSSIPISGVSYTKPTLGTVTTTFTSKPVITAKPRVIHGKKMY